MSKGINKVIIIGNCGQDPDTRYFPDGGAVTNITVATSESWKDKQTGQMQEKTEWHRVVFRDRGNYKLGEIAGKFLKKGAKIYVEGKLQTRQWEQDGVKRYTTEIIANDMQMLDSKDKQDAAPAQQQQPQQQPQQKPAQQTSLPAAPAGFDSFDDDIPF